jgi:2-alkyl-3-oxoalkanoate reductase
MRVFITGATGVIGRRVVPLLLEQGHAVTVARRRGGSNAPWAREVRVASVDLFDVATLAPAFADHDAVINLATHLPSPLGMMFRRAWRTNDAIRRIGSRNVADAALAAGVSLMIQESFALAYPDRGDEWIDEAVPLEPAPYTRTVLDAEASAMRFAGHGRRGVALRFATFYGPDSVQLPLVIHALRWGWAPLPGGPCGFVSSVSHDDAASAVVHAMGARTGVYNVADDEPVRRREYLDSLAARIGTRPPTFLPRWADFLFGSVGRVLSRSVRVANAKLRTETGWTPRYSTIREGWAATVTEMRSH